VRAGVGQSVAGTGRGRRAGPNMAPKKPAKKRAEQARRGGTTRGQGCEARGGTRGVRSAAAVPVIGRQLAAQAPPTGTVAEQRMLAPRAARRVAAGAARRPRRGAG